MGVSAVALHCLDFGRRSNENQIVEGGRSRVKTAFEMFLEKLVELDTEDAFVEAHLD